MLRKLGFSLLETATVMAVSGLILGGIYMGTATYMERYKRAKFDRQFTTMIDNVRKAHATLPSFQLPDTRQKVLDMNLFPPDMPVDQTYAAMTYPSAAVYYDAFGIRNVLSGTGQRVTLTFGYPNPSDTECLFIMQKYFSSAEVIARLGIIAVISGHSGYAAMIDNGPPLALNYVASSLTPPDPVTGTPVSVNPHTFCTNASSRPFYVIFSLRKPVI